jgi:single-strand DNA-binding protein
MNETILTIAGNLVDDPELRFTPAGQPVAKFRIASTPRYFDKASNSWKDGDSLFLTVNVWRQVAENVAESMTRGTRAIVTGRLRQRSYETKEGEKRTVYELEADEVGVAEERHGQGREGRPHRRGSSRPAGERQGRGPVGQRGIRRLQRRTAVLAEHRSARSGHAGRGGRLGVSMDELGEHDEDGQGDQALTARPPGRPLLRSAERARCVRP